MVLLRCLSLLLSLAAVSAQAQTPAADPPPAEAATTSAAALSDEQRQALRGEYIRQRIEVRREQMRRNAAGEMRVLEAPLFDGYVLEFEHNLVFEDLREQSGLKVREYEVALRLIEPKLALAELMQRLVDAGFTVESPIGPPQERVLRFWRQGRSLEDARLTVHVGERALPQQPTPPEAGATGILILRVYERIEG